MHFLNFVQTQQNSDTEINAGGVCRKLFKSGSALYNFRTYLYVNNYIPMSN